MHPRIREIIDNSKYCQAAVSEVGTLLPADDAELDQWIAEVVRNHDQGGFVYLVFSALHLERKVSSRHLGTGLPLLPDYTTLGCVAWKVQGDDVPEQLFAGLRHGGISHELRAGALLVVAIWCRERRGGVLPADLLTEARLLARNKKLEPMPVGLLFALARSLDDAPLLALLRQFDGRFISKAVALLSADGLGRSLLGHCRGPMFNRVLETPKLEHSGFTMRRAVAKIGRNDPCPCGSGKKYKHCCSEKDQQRLRLSTAIPGMTYAEVWADPEKHLTLARLEDTLPQDLPRLDPRKIARELLPPYLARLSGLGLLDETAQAFEKLGCPDDLYDAWHLVMWTTVQAGRKDIAERLMKVCGGLVPPTEPLHPGAQLLLARDEPAAFLKTLEAVAMKVLGTAAALEPETLADGLLASPFRALGILVARGMIPITAKKEAVFLLDQILAARVKLNLSLDDPYSDLLDKRFADEEVAGGKATEALRLAQQKLEAKAREVREMKQALEQLRGEIERREKNPPAPVQPIQPAPAAPVDENTLHELRAKVGALKADLKERHHERAALRRELEKTHTDLETLRAKQAQLEAHEAPPRPVDPEEQLLLPGDVDGNQPVRLLEFPRKFHDTLASFPRPVGRGAMTLLGRLAAGDPAAFVGVVRLKDCPATLRVRIGIDYRLLFRLLPEHVQVVDLINRKDLERRIKTLRMFPAFEPPSGDNR